MKKLAQMFVLVATGAATAKLTDLVKPSLGTPALAVAGLAAGALLLAILEHKYTLPLNWWWHRFWYLRDLREYLADLQRNDSGLTDDIPSGIVLPNAQVMVEGKRQDLVAYAVERLTDRSNGSVRLFVQGEPGSGKSFAALQIALELARSAQWRPWRRMPVLIRLGRYREGTLQSYIAGEIQKTTVRLGGEALASGLRRLMSKGRITLILDALDETPEAIRTKMLAELHDFAKPSKRGVPMLLTVRSREILPAEVEFRLEVLEMQPLDDAAVDALIEVYARRG